MTNTPLDQDGLPDIYSPDFPSDQPLPIEVVERPDDTDPDGSRQEEE